jgi:hypothetical protein
MGVIIKPLGTVECHWCKDGYHWTWVAREACRERADEGRKPIR